MPVQANITLNSVVYSPRGRDANGNSGWANTALSASHPRMITESIRGPGQNGVHRVMFKLVLPKVVGESDECGCVGDLKSTSIATIEVVIPSNFTLAEREDLAAQIQALVATTVFETAVEGLEGSW